VKHIVRRLSAVSTRRSVAWNALPAEAQIDFGSGASLVDAQEKRRRTRVLLNGLSYSSKAYSESVCRQTRRFYRQHRERVLGLGRAENTGRRQSESGRKRAQADIRWKDGGYSFYSPCLNEVRVK